MPSTLLDELLAGRTPAVRDTWRAPRLLPSAVRSRCAAVRRAQWHEGRLAAGGVQAAASGCGPLLEAVPAVHVALAADVLSSDTGRLTQPRFTSGPVPEPLRRHSACSRAKLPRLGFLATVLVVPSGYLRCGDAPATARKDAGVLETHVLSFSKQ